MEFGLLTRFHRSGDGSEFVQRLESEAAQAGHGFSFVNPVALSLQLGDGQPQLFLNGRTLPRFDMLHYALRWDDDYAWELVDAMAINKMPLVPATRVPLADNITMARLYAREGLAIPRSWVLGDVSQLEMIFTQVQYPCVFKVRRGALGRRMYIVKHEGEARRVAQEIEKEGFSFMVQEIVRPTHCDVRAFFVGDDIVCAVERAAPEGCLRPVEEGNARVSNAILSDDEKRFVRSIARIYSAPYGAVSFVRSDEGLVLLEISRTPSFKEVEVVQSVNIAREIIQFCAAHAK